MDPGTSATVVVLRSHSFVGMSPPQRVYLDGEPIARVGIGQYVCFEIGPGNHTIGISDESVTLDLEVGDQYFFQVNPKTLSLGEREMDLLELPREAGLEEMAASEDVSPRSGPRNPGSIC